MKRTLLALALLAAVPFAASAAEGVSYNHVQGGYSATDTDSGDADGFGIDASVAVHDNIHLFGGYNTQEIDGTNIDIDRWKLGVGYNYAFSDKADLVARVAYENADVANTVDFDGYSAEVGVRGAMGKHFEGYALAGYEDYKDLDGDFYGRVGALAKFNDNWGVNGDVKFADGDTQWFVGPRFSW